MLPEAAGYRGGSTSSSLPAGSWSRWVRWLCVIQSLISAGWAHPKSYWSTPLLLYSSLLLISQIFIFYFYFLVHLVYILEKITSTIKEISVTIWALCKHRPPGGCGRLNIRMWVWQCGPFLVFRSLPSGRLSLPSTWRNQADNSQSIREILSSFHKIVQSWWKCNSQVRCFKSLAKIPSLSLSMHPQCFVLFPYV